MLKVALIVLTVSISNPEQPPDISLPVFYNSVTECHNQLDELKKDINAIETVDNNNNTIQNNRTKTITNLKTSLNNNENIINCSSCTDWSKCSCQDSQAIILGLC